jgi:hypothetical protein
MLLSRTRSHREQMPLDARTDQTRVHLAASMRLHSNARTASELAGACRNVVSAPVYHLAHPPGHFVFVLPTCYFAITGRPVLRIERGRRGAGPEPSQFGVCHGVRQREQAGNECIATAALVSSCAGIDS